MSGKGFRSVPDVGVHLPLHLGKCDGCSLQGGETAKGASDWRKKMINLDRCVRVATALTETHRPSVS